MTARRACSNHLRFLRSWAPSPLCEGALAPTGETLADIVTREISAETGPVIELGPGAGAFTRSLLARGVRESDLTLVEYGSEFVVNLQMQFPRAHVLWMDAARLGNVCLHEDVCVGAVVSSLPLSVMATRKVMSILDGAFGCMRRGGAFYQVSHATHCPVPRTILSRLRLKAERMEASASTPPVTVYRITQHHLEVVHHSKPEVQNI